MKTKLMMPTVMLCASMAPMAMAASDADVSDKVVIRHDAVKPVKFDCARREVPQARVKGTEVLDPEALLIAATKGKAFPYTATESLAWLDMTLRSYGSSTSLSSLQGTAKVAALRVATLVRNDYTIAAQMAHGINVKTNVVPLPHAYYLNNLVVNLTEPAHSVPEIGATNELIKHANEALEPASEKVKSYARWAIRAFAYDDDVAIDAAMSGICMMKVTAADMKVIEKAILIARYDPKRDYVKGAHKH